MTRILVSTIRRFSIAHLIYLIICWIPKRITVYSYTRDDGKNEYNELLEQLTTEEQEEINLQEQRYIMEYENVSLLCESSEFW